MLRKPQIAEAVREGLQQLLEAPLTDAKRVTVAFDVHDIEPVANLLDARRPRRISDQERERLRTAGRPWQFRRSRTAASADPGGQEAR